MKKLISILTLLAILLSLCACGKKEASTEDTQPSDDTVNTGNLTPEQQFGHIDEMTPVDGVYQIWSPKGVQNMANHPDASFELLCTIDMQGATIAPLGSDSTPFTGTLNGANFFIKNFTVQGGDEESFGFVSVNQGTVRNLVLENVTFIPGANAKNFGCIAGVNEGELIRCTVSGTMEPIEAAPDGATCGGLIGKNSGSIENSSATVDIAFNSPNSAYVGGLIGLCEGGKVQYLETHGAIDTVGTNKSFGLFAGQTNVVFNTCVFSGPSNTVDGKLLTNFTGNPDDDELAVALNALWRDNGFLQPLSENELAMRQTVVDTMNRLCTVEWKVKQDLAHSCICQLSTCHGMYNADYTYYGIPYNHKASPITRVEYCLDEDGYVKDWFYDMGSFDGFDMYFGGDCSTTIMHAWFTVSNSIDFLFTTFMIPAVGRGTIKVGDYEGDFLVGETSYTEQYMLANGEDKMYECYTQMRMGDAFVAVNEQGGHTRMAVSDPIIVRDQQGNIDPNYSYFLISEQGSPVENIEEKTYSYCKANFKRNFSSLYQNWYIPITCEELITGEMETPEANLEGGCSGYAGMFTGTVQCNYHLVSVTLKITDSEGNVVVEHPYFSNIQKNDDYGSTHFTARNYIDHLNLADFAAVVAQLKFEKGESYSYTLTANLATFDDFVVHEGQFNYG